MAKVHCVLLLGVVAAAFSVVSAGISDADKETIKALLGPILKECGKEHGVTEEDILAAKKTHDVDALDSCFYRCFFKKIGLIDDQGLYAVETAKENHKKYIKDEEFLKKVDAVTDECSVINEKEVSDGTEGCDRAKLLINCLKEHKDSINPILE
uniref:Odorant binding protein n=1 Tax=Semiothisa cinerearia TaxID=2249628 RepID=A0A889XLA1_9NEOP|nr:odorant binding protein [Semiothisa cinerearia]